MYFRKLLDFLVHSVDLFFNKIFAFEFFDFRLIIILPAVPQNTFAPIQFMRKRTPLLRYDVAQKDTYTHTIQLTMNGTSNIIVQMQRTI